MISTLSTSKWQTFILSLIQWECIYNIHPANAKTVSSMRKRDSLVFRNLQKAKQISGRVITACRILRMGHKINIKNPSKFQICFNRQFQKQ